MDLTTGIRSQQILLLEIVRFFCNLHPDKLRLAQAHYGYYYDKIKTDWYDMTAVIELADIAREINDFLKFNQGDGLVKRLEKISDELDSQNSFSGTMVRISDDIRDFTSIVTMNISPMAANVIKQLCEAIDQLSDKDIPEHAGAVRPFITAMRKLKAELSEHLPQDRNPLWGWQLALCQWALDRKLYQQAATQAEELITTRFSEEYYQKKKGMSPEKAAKNALNYHKIRDKMGKFICNRAKALKDKDPFHQELFEIVHGGMNIVGVRNNINHAYMTDKKNQCQRTNPKYRSGHSFCYQICRKQQHPGQLLG